MRHVHTPERSGVDTDAPSPQRARMSSHEANYLEVLEAEQKGWNKAGIIDLTEKDFDHIIRSRVLARPTFKSLFSETGPGTHSVNSRTEHLAWIGFGIYRQITRSPISSVLTHYRWPPGEREARKSLNMSSDC